jgi:hypothetical protein
VLDIDIATGAASLQTLTPGECTGTAVRSVRNVDANTEITAEITLANRILSGSYVRIKVPLEQFSRTSETVKYRPDGNPTAVDMTVVTTDSTHVTLEYQEFCSGGSAI